MNVFKRLFARIGKLIADELTKPLEEIKETQKKQGIAIDRLSEQIHKMQEDEVIARECDLASMDDRLCHLIKQCRMRGYTTALERRNITRLHEAYRARGGNHGEENEYAVFQSLPTEEEFERRNHHENQLGSPI